ncbi:hypothetical protein GQ53DRAFT_820833 [Thozetella sp. PMI_491]|nr:hypothetical protein GQ53DRAFT_820833 [Thozetella sp. PMI_491]
MAEDADSNQRLMAATELPPCLGPKLQAFKYRHAPIKFLNQLDEQSDEGSGRQGYVFKVEIRNTIYALKIFKFFEPWAERLLLGEDENLVSDDILRFHTDPFFAECRAYGRIQEVQEKEKAKSSIAAKCYGFLTLTEKDESFLLERGLRLWDLPPTDEYRVRTEGSPVRAIVKEYVDKDPAIGVRVLRRMLKALRFLHSQKIIHRDVKMDNFKNGLLLDLGSAWTEPHCVLDVKPKELVDLWREADLEVFDDIVKEKGLSSRIRALPNYRFRGKLRKK